MYMHGGTYRYHAHLEVEIEVHHGWQEEHLRDTGVISLVFREEPREAWNECASDVVREFLLFTLVKG